MKGMGGWGRSSTQEQRKLQRVKGLQRGPVNAESCSAQGISFPDSSLLFT